MPYIYVYSDKSRYHDKIAHDEKPLIKIGYTTKDPDFRIAQQDGSSNSEPLIKLYSEEIEDFDDRVIHQFLEYYGIE